MGEIMKYNDDTLDINKFDEIAREYNKQLSRIVVQAESSDFAEVLNLSGKIVGILERAKFRYVKNDRFKEFDSHLNSAVRLLGEFCNGECGRQVERIHSDFRLSDIHKFLGELISKLIRIEISDRHKRQVFYNIIDKFLEILLMLIEEGQKG